MFAFIRRFFSPLVRALWAFLKIIFRAGTEIIMASLKDLAVDVVREIKEDPTLLTDEDKRKAAFERLRDRAIEEGIEAKDSLLNTAIELAVQYVKTF